VRDCCGGDVVYGMCCGIGGGGRWRTVVVEVGGGIVAIEKGKMGAR